MKKHTSLSAGLMIWTGLFTLLLLGLVEGSCFFLLPDQPPPWLAAKISADLHLSDVHLADFHLYKELLMIAVAGGLVLWMLLLWLVIRRSCRKEQAIRTVSAKSRKSEVKEGAAAKKERRLHNDKKLFLHILSVLQTEGRLLDFLNEDLNHYEDAQIGAAVRGVHERCNAVLAKYVTLQPMSQQDEGEAITVPAGFDPGVYRLSGNITGDPPFEGKLVHAGWRAGRLNIPGFVFSGDPEIIAPMEVNVE